MAAGELLSQKSARVENLFVVLSGRITIYVDRGAGMHKAFEWRAGDVGGLLPYSRLVNAPGNSYAEEDSTVLNIQGAHLPEMIRECHGITSILVHTMLDRARAFTSSDLHDEKMVSLGKLSAGLAHELNNPAAATKRSAALLKDRLEEAERATRALGGFRLTESQWAAVDAVRASCLAKRVSGVRSPVAQAEREDEIAQWLEKHGLDVSIAEALAETEVTFDALERITAAVLPAALDSVLRWAAAGCAVRELASEIQEAAQRISGLVTAIKGFTHMDQAAVAGAVDLTAGLDNTVAVLKSKARTKSVAVTVDVEKGLPAVRGFAGELNQVWANLIDNALDAVPDGGRVDVSARRERPGAVVRVIDDGPGIPDAIRERIFDPFFTTKPVGQGTGLGLDIVRRLVRHNDGEIEVDSKPGRTEFRVTLPLAGAAGPAGTP
jgi:signal transduction histidine kinase